VLSRESVDIVAKVLPIIIALDYDPDNPTATPEYYQQLNEMQQDPRLAPYIE
jgi:hypothetical protein